MRKETREHLDNIIDCISCADGGLSLIALMAVLSQMDKEAEGGDPDAEEVVNVTKRFSKFIDIAKGRSKNAREHDEQRP